MDTSAAEKPDHQGLMGHISPFFLPENPPTEKERVSEGRPRQGNTSTQEERLHVDGGHLF